MKFLEDKEGIRKIRVLDDDATKIDYLDNISDPVALTQGVLNTKARIRVKAYKSIRVSELDSMCTRDWIIGNVENREDKSFIPFGTICTFDLGSAMHHWIQNKSSYFGNNLLGYWVCRACSNRRRFGVRPDKSCEFCGASHNATEYMEYAFRLQHPHYVSARVDAIIKVEDKYRFGEIKTYSKPIEGPNGRDVAQLAAYMWYSKYDESDTKLPIEIDRSVGYLIYFSKMFSFGAPIKTFPVRLTKPLIDPLRTKVKECADGVDAGILPKPLDVCMGSDWQSSKADKCHSKVSCKSFYDQSINNILNRRVVV
jgi:hypothetical protein